MGKNEESDFTYERPTITVVGTLREKTESHHHHHKSFSTSSDFHYAHHHYTVNVS